MQQVEELLHELRCDINFQLSDLNRLIDHKLEEKFVNALKVGPSGVHFFLLLNTSLCEVQIAFLDIGKRTENVLFNHLHDQVQSRYNNTYDVLLILQHLLEFGDRV